MYQFHVPGSVREHSGSIKPPPGSETRPLMLSYASPAACASAREVPDGRGADAGIPRRHAPSLRMPIFVRMLPFIAPPAVTRHLSVHDVLKPSAAAAPAKLATMITIAILFIAFSILAYYGCLR